MRCRTGPTYQRQPTDCSSSTGARNYCTLHLISSRLPSVKRPNSGKKVSEAASTPIRTGPFKNLRKAGHRRKTKSPRNFSQFMCKCGVAWALNVYKQWQEEATHFDKLTRLFAVVKLRGRSSRLVWLSCQDTRTKVKDFWRSSITREENMKHSLKILTAFWKTVKDGLNLPNHLTSDRCPLKTALQHSDVGETSDTGRTIVSKVCGGAAAAAALRLPRPRVQPRTDCSASAAARPRAGCSPSAAVVAPTSAARRSKGRPATSVVDRGRGRTCSGRRRRASATGDSRRRAAAWTAPRRRTPRSDQRERRGSAAGGGSWDRYQPRSRRPAQRWCTEWRWLLLYRPSTDARARCLLTTDRNTDLYPHSTTVTSKSSQLVIYRPFSAQIWLYQRRKVRAGELFLILIQWMKAGDILTLILAVFLFSSHPKRERNREVHLNYYASAYNRGDNYHTTNQIWQKRACILK